MMRLWSRPNQSSDYQWRLIISCNIPVPWSTEDMALQLALWHVAWSVGIVDRACHRAQQRAELLNLQARPSAHVPDPLPNHPSPYSLLLRIT